MSPSIAHSRGVVLLVLLLMMTTGSALMLGLQFKGHNARLRAEQESGRALAAAREALIAYAINYTDNYGHNTRGGTGRLPCPAVERFSKPEWKCNESNLGFLPALWERDGKVMDIDYLERFLDRDLWYSVAADFRFNPSYNPLSATGVGNFLSVDQIDDVVAVIVDPGPPLAHQLSSRPGIRVDAYLEGENGDGDTNFSVQSSGNDRLVWITAEQLVPLIERRVLGIARDWLLEYKHRYGRYPYASLPGDAEGACVEDKIVGMLSMTQGNCSGLSLGQFISATVPRERMINETWFVRNQWPLQIIYRVDSSCVGTEALSACDGVQDEPSSLRVGLRSAEVLLIASGKEITSAAKGAMQDRESSDLLIEYLDLPELLEAVDDYPLVRPGEQSNDQMLFIAQPAS